VLHFQTAMDCHQVSEAGPLSAWPALCTQHLAPGPAHSWLSVSICWMVNKHQCYSRQYAKFRCTALLDCILFSIPHTEATCEQTFNHYKPVNMYLEKLYLYPDTPHCPAHLRNRPWCIQAQAHNATHLLVLLLNIFSITLPFWILSLQMMCHKHISI